MGCGPEVVLAEGILCHGPGEARNAWDNASMGYSYLAKLKEGVKVLVCNLDFRWARVSARNVTQACVIGCRLSREVRLLLRGFFQGQVGLHTLHTCLGFWVRIWQPRP